MPPMPPPDIAGAPLSFFGLSATMASVVISSPAIDAAFCRAARTTLVGSMMPLETRFTYSIRKRQIAINSGEDGSVIVGKILEKDQYAYGFDAQNGGSRCRASGRRSACALS